MEAFLFAFWLFDLRIPTTDLFQENKRKGGGGGDTHKIHARAENGSLSLRQGPASPQWVFCALAPASKRLPSFCPRWEAELQRSLRVLSGTTRERAVQRLCKTSAELFCTSFPPPAKQSRNFRKVAHKIWLPAMKLGESH